MQLEYDRQYAEMLTMKDQMTAMSERLRQAIEDRQHHQDLAKAAIARADVMAGNYSDLLKEITILSTDNVRLRTALLSICRHHLNIACELMPLLIGEKRV